MLDNTPAVVFTVLRSNSKRGGVWARVEGHTSLWYQACSNLMCYLQEILLSSCKCHLISIRRRYLSADNVAWDILRLHAEKQTADAARSAV